MTLMPPYEVPRLTTSSLRNLILPPSTPNSPISPQWHLKCGSLKLGGGSEGSQGHGQ